MAGKVGEAFVEIVADYTKFAQEAEKRLNVLLKRLGSKADFTSMTEGAGDAGEESAQEYTESFEKEIDRSTNRTRRRQAGQRVGRDFSRSVNEGVDNDVRRRGNIFTRLFGGTDRRDRDMLGGAFSRIGDVISGVFQTIGAAGSAVGSVVGTVASLSSGFLTLLVVAGLLGPVIFVLVGALVSLSGVLLLLPVGLLAIGAAVGVLMIAFSGFGEALSALADGDVAKFNEALKGLSPSAQKVAKEFQGLWPQFERLKESVQESFFAPLVGSFERLGNNLLPLITPKLSTIADKLGSIAGTLIDRLNTPEGLSFFEKVLDSVARIIDRAGPGIERLFTALANAVIASLPFAERLFGAISDGLADFGEFIDTKVADGTFQDFLDNALETGQDFMTVIGDLIDLFGALFEDTDEGGQRFLQDISEALRKLTAFFESPDGKAALEAMIKLAKLFGAWMIDAAGKVGMVYRTLKKLKDMAVSAWEWLGKVIDRVGKAASPGLAAGFRALDKLPFFADGGVVTRPTIGMIGEAGAEVVVPLNKPGRARQLMEQTGLVDLAGGLGAGGDTQVIVYLGTEQITEILDQRVVKGFKAQGRRLAQGVREG